MSTSRLHKTTYQEKKKASVYIEKKKILHCNFCLDTSLCLQAYTSQRNGPLAVEIHTTRVPRYTSAGTTGAKGHSSAVVVLDG